jgi:BASS family bile acid:Na+ symporter
VEGQVRIASTKHHLKLVHSAILLLLNYSNASVSLPSSVADPDWDFLALTMGIVVSLCAFSFSAGWWIARCLRLDTAERVPRVCVKLAGAAQSIF